MKSYSALWFPVLVALMMQAIFVTRGLTPVLDGGLYGPDAYMRLARVTELAEGGGWAHSVSERSNAPSGLELHWTRPFDVLLLAGAAPLAPLLGFRAALYWWAVVISPLLQIATLMVLFRAGRRFFEPPGRVFLCLIFLCQPGVIYDFMAGRPDHQSLMGLLFALSVALTLRLMGSEPRPRQALGAGVVVALALWVSVESLVAAALMLAALGLSWVWRGGELARLSLIVALAATAGMGLALLVDPMADGVLAAHYDRLSIVHVVLVAVVALFWLAVAGLEQGARAVRGVPGRAAIAAAGAALVLGLAWLAFPKLFGGPYVDLDPALGPIFRKFVGQSRPLFSDDPESLKQAVYWLGPVALALPFLIQRGWRGPPGERPLWLYLLGGLLLYLVLTISALRWSSYLGLLVAFPVTGLLMAVLGIMDRLALPWRSLARALTVVLFSVGFLSLGILFQRQSAQFARAEVAESAAGKCSLQDFAEFANRAAADGDTPQRILANVFSGPELLYRTPHQVVATPLHRNAAGIGDAYAILSAASDRRARELVRGRGITWILLCPGSVEPVLFRRPDGATTLYQRLAAGAPPPWLRPLALPPGLEGFRLFEVAG
jgi:hypothetical protein